MKRAQRGAALLAAMLTVTLVATLASAAMWQQWRSTEVEAAERARSQNAWMLTGALDWARLILIEDARSGGNEDDLSEPWAVPLAESRLSTFLAAADPSNISSTTEEVDLASETFLSGSITDAQSRLNVTNLVTTNHALDPLALAAFGRLFSVLGLSNSELQLLASNLVLASATNPDAQAPLLPKGLYDLAWLGVSPTTIALLAPYVTVLPARTSVNLNTAPAQVIYAAVAGIDMAKAQSLVNHRTLAPFKSLSSIQQQLENLTLDGNAVNVSTSFFEVRGRLRTARGTVEELSLLQRTGTNVQILRRERVTPELSAVAGDS